MTHDKKDNNDNILAGDGLVTSEISPSSAAVLTNFHGQVPCTNSADVIYDTHDYGYGDHDYVLF